MSEPAPFVVNQFVRQRLYPTTLWRVVSLDAQRGSARVVDGCGNERRFLYEALEPWPRELGAEIKGGAE